MEILLWTREISQFCQLIWHHTDIDSMDDSFCTIETRDKTNDMLIIKTHCPMSNKPLDKASKSKFQKKRNKSTAKLHLYSASPLIDSFEWVDYGTHYTKPTDNIMIDWIQGLDFDLTTISSHSHRKTHELDRKCGFGEENELELHKLQENRASEADRAIIGWKIIRQSRDKTFRNWFRFSQRKSHGERERDR